MLRKLVRLVLRSRRQRRALQQLRAVGTGARVQLGSGGNLLDGWVNTDVGGSAPYCLDAREPWPLNDVAAVYADNVFEHFTIDEARTVLINARRAMAAGAVLRLCVPDVRGPAEVYLGGGADLTAMLDRHRRNGYDVNHPQDVLRVILSLNDHASGYPWDEASLTAELVAAGFCRIQRCMLGKSDTEGLRGLESRTEPIDERLLLVVEASRP
jgi:hypothetical protein